MFSEQALHDPKKGQQNAKLGSLPSLSALSQTSTNKEATPLCLASVHSISGPASQIPSLASISLQMLSTHDSRDLSRETSEIPPLKALSTSMGYNSTFNMQNPAPAMNTTDGLMVLSRCSSIVSPVAQLNNSQFYSAQPLRARSVSSNEGESHSQMARRRNRSKKYKILSVAATQYLKQWMKKNYEHPYPSKEEKDFISKHFDMTMAQVNNWFVNARRKVDAHIKQSRFLRNNEGEEYLPQTGPYSPSVSVSPSLTASDDGRDRRHDLKFLIY
ncbi:hypothetical protein MP638_005315 [Amoeboaphelidium occidentale]|nr:hypothetical protein MP638_005315 [Amoeboaphelidium occidentale]